MTVDILCRQCFAFAFVVGDDEFDGVEDSADTRSCLMGFYLGIGGVLTFKNCRLADTLTELNQSQITNHKFEIINRLLLETDAPYMR